MKILYDFERDLAPGAWPLAARRALAAAAFDPTAPGPAALSLPDRIALAAAGQLDAVDVAYVHALVARGDPSLALPSPGAKTPERELIPDLLAANVGEGAWAALRPVDRFALRTLAAEGDPRLEQARLELALRRVDLTAAAIPVERVVAHVRRAFAGGVAVFVGTVRDHDAGHAVNELEYESYPSMAIAEMQRIVDEIEGLMPGVRLAVTHRVGRLAIGDDAVVCAASGAHRAEAFAACRALIDRIKDRVPIWKREHAPGGVRWVDER